jgi:hypothetical protein
LDFDFSCAKDFADTGEVQASIFAALRAKFEGLGLVLFDERFYSRPSDRAPGAKWGGYTAEFKIIDRRTFSSLSGRLEDMRVQAIPNGPAQTRRFRIEISPFELCDEKMRIEIGSQPCYVYSLPMIAAEKLRAICQQSPLYPLRRHPTPRARDFYDIYITTTEGRVDFGDASTRDLVRRVFAIKDVQLALIGDIPNRREFHRTDWSSVEISVSARLRQFDFYFEFVLGESTKLEPLWVV